MRLCPPVRWSCVSPKASTSRCTPYAARGLGGAWCGAKRLECGDLAPLFRRAGMMGFSTAGQGGEAAARVVE